jgi:hypothetical protein
MHRECERERERAMEGCGGGGERTASRRAAPRIHVCTAVGEGGGERRLEWRCFGEICGLSEKKFLSLLCETNCGRTGDKLARRTRTIK